MEGNPPQASPNQRQQCVVFPKASKAIDWLNREKGDPSSIVSPNSKTDRTEKWSSSLLLQNHRALLLDHLLFKDSPFFQVLGSHAHAFLLFLSHLLWHCAVPVCIYLTKNSITDPPPPLSPHKHPPLALTDNFFLTIDCTVSPFLCRYK